MSGSPTVVSLYIVKVKEDFYREKEEYTKFFISFESAIAYQDDIITNKIWKVPTIVVMETSLAVVDPEFSTMAYVIDCSLAC